MHILIRLVWFIVFGWWLASFALGGVILMGIIPPLWPIAFALAMKLGRIAFLWGD